MTIPGVQKPHCDAPPAANASAHAAPSGRPSSVVTSRPATRADRRHARDAGLAVDQTVQQPHWPCGLQPSFGGARAEPLAQDVEQRGAVVGDLDGPPVEAERGQLKLCPQPQVRVAFGFVMANPDWSRPSL